MLAYLNCDEQYLPDALRKVSRFFDQHPGVDVIFGDTVIVGPQGEYICERRALLPHRLHTLISMNLSFLTAATFMRRRVFHELGLHFDPSLRDVGDAEWTLRLLKAGVRMATMKELTSAYTETGTNMSLGPNMARERAVFAQTAPLWARTLAPFLVAYFRSRRWRAGHYRCQPHSYVIYTKDGPNERKLFQANQPTFRWSR